MLSSDPEFWSGRLRSVLERYEEPLLRQVAAKLFKPRNFWPLDELLERTLATVGNAAVIDRRFQDLEPSGRRLLALIGHSRQPQWRLGNVMELLAALGHTEGLQPIFALFEAGLLYPDLAPETKRLPTFEQWLGQGNAAGLMVFAHPLVTARALRQDLGLPDDLERTTEVTGVHEADGLEWPLRLAVLWQQVAAGPPRLTQQGEFFKRDLDRLRSDAMLNGPPADGGVELPDAGLLTVALARINGLVQENEGELRAGALPAAWEQGLGPSLESLWRSVPCLDSWDALNGWRGGQSLGNPFPSAYLLVLLLLGRMPEGSWAYPEAIEQWLLEHHPYWSGESVRPSKRRPWVPTFLLGLAFPLRLVDIAKDDQGEVVVRLSATGRWLLGLAEAPPTLPTFPKTILVQPNLEIIAYRQGLTPSLIGRLSQFAAWKSLGAACTLQLEPDSVYRALESGQTFETILQALEQHGMRPTPPAVVESLRTWANKRDRLSVYASAALLEFASADDLNEALGRGVPAVRISDRLAVVVNESEIDYRHFRLAGTRDYGLPPEKCVDVEGDGVTLTIDQARADLLLETELKRFAELVQNPGSNGRRQYRLTPASLTAGEESGLHLRALEDWFMQRTGQTITPAARLLLTRTLLPPVELRRQLVLHVGTPEVADGLLQWPETRELIQDRLGPTALAVAEENVEELQKRLGSLGLGFLPAISPET